MISTYVQIYKIILKRLTYCYTYNIININNKMKRPTCFGTFNFIRRKNL